MCKKAHQLKVADTVVFSEWVLACNASLPDSHSAGRSISESQRDARGRISVST